MELFIKVGSVTNAQRGQRILRNYGDRANIKRVSNPLKDEGCGYALQVTANDNTPVSILQNNAVSVRGVDVV